MFSKRNTDQTDPSLTTSEEDRKRRRSVKWESQVSSRAVFAGLNVESERQRAKEEDIHFGLVFLPWNRRYKTWRFFTVLCSYLTAFFTTYQVAFLPAGFPDPTDAIECIDYFFVSIFVLDIGINFNLAYFSEGDELVSDRRLIARNYFRLMFWIDLIGIFPFYQIALACAGLMGQDTITTLYMAILSLFRLFRLHRVKQFLDLKYDSKISLMWFTFTRNFLVALMWVHFNACTMYFIARLSSFDEESTWIGGSVDGLSLYERYVTSLYWSVVTLATVGYGDYSPVNSAEKIWSIIFMSLNIVLVAWFVGSITLLIIKNDEKTGRYRDALNILAQYSSLHSFDRDFHKRLKTHLKLDFNNRELADEQVLKHFPSSIRCNVLRQLYLPSLIQTNLMQGIRQQFVNAFLTACRVEVFSPGDEILQRGFISSDLYFLIEGIVKLLPIGENEDSSVDPTNKVVGGYGSVLDSEFRPEGSEQSKRLGAGEFINDIGFFTETPQIDTVRTVTICKTLTMSRSAYALIAHDHPGSVSKILQNLLSKVKEAAEEIGSLAKVNLPTRLELLTAGSLFCPTEKSAHADEVQRTVASIQNQADLIDVQDLIEMYINKQNDMHTTRFLFAASRGDTKTISLMCDQGFDPNDADYDSRTALMEAAMRGNAKTVKLLLDYDANPNLVDKHGTSALYEAAKNGHETTMNELLNHSAKLCMDESKAASTLCQVVFDGDILTLRRLLQAGIQMNAGDYDKRTAVHIAAAEGNVAALKVLIEYGADLTVRDRWNNTIYMEAERACAGQLLEYLKTLKAPVEEEVSSEEEASIEGEVSVEEGVSIEEKMLFEEKAPVEEKGRIED